MKIIKTQNYEIASGEEITLHLCDNKQGDTVVGEVYLDVHSGALSVEGAVCLEDECYKAIKVIDMANYAVLDAISGAGYYMIPAAGLAILKMTASADTEVFVKTTF